MATADGGAARACIALGTERTRRAAYLCFVRAKVLLEACIVPAFPRGPPFFNHLFIVRQEFEAFLVAFAAHAFHDLNQACFAHLVLAKELFIVFGPAFATTSKLNVVGLLESRMV